MTSSLHGPVGGEALRLRRPFRVAACLLALAPAALTAQQVPASSPVPAQPPAGSVGGMGDVNLYPKRVVLTERDRTATVGLYNRASASGDYDILIADMAMRPDGQLAELASLGDAALAARVKPASPLLRWSPRRVTLPPNEAQLVRIMVRLPQGLPPGEYRSHFSATSVPPPSDDVSVEGAAQAASGGVGVRIVPRFGISIPVIVRVGPTTLTSGLKDFELVRTNGAPALRMTILRSGTRSSFGDITITAPGVKKPLAQIKGIGVYPEIDQRTVQVPLDPQAPPASYAKGTRLTITYVDDDLEPGKVLATGAYVVP
ncbi:MAG: hypothetical protein ACKOPQ_07375 [Novosphingobium sp.]